MGLYGETLNTFCLAAYTAIDSYCALLLGSLVHIFGRGYCKRCIGYMEGLYSGHCFINSVL